MENSERNFVIHHLDRDENNSERRNLVFLCKRCHAREHSVKRKNRSCLLLKPVEVIAKKSEPVLFDAESIPQPSLEEVEKLIEEIEREKEEIEREKYRQILGQVVYS